MTTPCCITRCSVSTWAIIGGPQQSNRISSGWLVTPHALLIREASVVNVLEWDCANGKPVSDVGNSSYLPEQTANVVRLVEEVIISKSVMRGGIAPTRKKGTTKQGLTTMHGEVEHHRLSIRRRPMNTTVVYANDVGNGLFLFTTKMKTAVTPPSAISNLYVKGVISYTTTARTTSRRTTDEGIVSPLGNHRDQALNYGMKEKKLAHDIKKSILEAKALIEAYMARYPAVAQFYADSINEVRQTGYAWTILGRRRFLPEILSNNADERWRAERQASNVPIQGSAADVVKMAMILIDEADIETDFGYHQLIQVHDEICFEGPQETLQEVKPVIKEIMEHPFDNDLAVPLTISMASGDNWMECH